MPYRHKITKYGDDYLDREGYLQEFNRKDVDWTDVVRIRIRIAGLGWRTLIGPWADWDDLMFRIDQHYPAA